MTSWHNLYDLITSPHEGYKDIASHTNAIYGFMVYFTYDYMIYFMVYFV
jgi:hypothetical protein